MSKKEENQTAPALPKLSYGEGTLSYDSKTKTIKYRKIVDGHRLSVSGKTLTEVFATMKEKEKEKKGQKSSIIYQSSSLLKDSLKTWIEIYKKQQLKARSYDRMICTFKNQILPYEIANRQVQAIDSPMIMTFFNALIREKYSYSVISKTYNLLKEYFEFIYVRNPAGNPMILYKKPSKEILITKERKMQILNDEQILKFRTEALKQYPNGRYVFWWGPLLVILLYTGMRINEALALKWSDIDFEKRTIHIDEGRSEIIDWEGTPKENCTYAYKVEYISPKSNAGIRTFYAMDIVIDCLNLIKKRPNYNPNENFVFLTTEGYPPKYLRNIYRALRSVYKRVGVEFESEGFHVLRHTFISLLCRKGIDKKVIATIVGHADTTMIERVYQHVLADEKIDAMKSINTLSYMDFDDFTVEERIS